MGDHKQLPWLLRAGSALVLAVGIALPLTSCSLLGVAPTPAATDAPTPTPTDVIDPSIPSEAPSATSVPVAPTATPVPTPTPTHSSAPGPARKKQAQPFITSADWSGGVLDVQALVPKIVESDGTCTVTAKRGGVVRTATASAAAGAQFTQCNPMDIPGSKLSSGTWTVTVTYASARSEGTSALRTVTVTK